MTNDHGKVFFFNMFNLHNEMHGNTLCELNIMYEVKRQDVATLKLPLPSPKCVQEKLQYNPFFVIT